MRIFRTWIAVAAGALLPLGCLPDDSGRLESNDYLREACWWQSDAKIRTLLLSMEEMRLEGRTRQEAYEQLRDFCDASEVGDDLYHCFYQVMDQVYSK